jgi:phage FluMu protein Com
MSVLQIIKCKGCGKVLCEANGEVKKICPKCKIMNHVIVTSLGVYILTGVDLASGPDKTVFHKI